MKFTVFYSVVLLTSVKNSLEISPFRLLRWKRSSCEESCDSSFANTTPFVPNPLTAWTLRCDCVRYHTFQLHKSVGIKIERLYLKNIAAKIYILVKIKISVKLPHMFSSCCLCVSNRRSLVIW